MKRRLQVVTLMVSTAISLGAAELAVRASFPHSRDHVVPAGLFSIDSALGWRLTSKSSGRHRTRYFDVLYEVDSRGFRDREPQRELGSGGVDVLLYGDSMIFGWGIEREARFDELIERRVPGTRLDDRAVPGYGIDQQLISYERDGGQGADAVMFFVSRSMLDRAVLRVAYRKPKPRFRLDDDGSLVLLPPAHRRGYDLLYRTLSPWYLPYFVDRQVARLRAPGRGSTGTGELRHEGSRLTPLERAILDRTFSLAAERGHRAFALSLLPAPLEAELDGLCNERGVRHIASGLPLIDRWTHGAEDHHWNRAAHEVLADLVAKHLLE